MERTETRTSFFATSSGLILLLIIAVAAPVFFGPSGLAASFTLPWMVMYIAYARPELDVRWYYLAAIPLIMYGAAVLAVLLFG